MDRFIFLSTSLFAFTLISCGGNAGRAVKHPGVSPDPIHDFPSCVLTRPTESYARSLDALVSDLQRTAERFHQSELSDDEREAYSRHLMMVSERLAGVANRVKSQSPVSTLLIVAGDNGAATDDRVAAIRELGDMKERAAVPVLMNLLPGELDIITVTAVVALGQIGDRRATPKLEEMYQIHDRHLPGILMAELGTSIKEIEKANPR